MTKTASKKTAEQEQNDIEALVVARMTSAQDIANKVFGAKSNLYGVHEIYDYLETLDDEEHEEFALDLGRCYQYAQKAHSVEDPTPEQVFGIFERIFGDDDFE